MNKSLLNKPLKHYDNDFHKLYFALSFDTKDLLKNLFKEINKKGSDITAYQRFVIKRGALCVAFLIEQENYKGE